MTDAQATLEAARITAEATRWAGWISGGLGLVAGGLVVFGAFRVGKAQVKTQDNQNKILEKQDEILRRSYNLELSRLKFELYEKRFSIYLSTKEFMKNFLIVFRLDNRGIFNMDREKFHAHCIDFINKYYDVMDSAYFLFEDREIYFEMGKIVEIIEKIKNDEEFYDIKSVNVNLVHAEMHQKWLTVNTLFRDYLAVETGFPL